MSTNNNTSTHTRSGPNHGGPDTRIMLLGGAALIISSMVMLAGRLDLDTDTLFVVGLGASVLAVLACVRGLLIVRAHDQLVVASEQLAKGDETYRIPHHDGDTRTDAAEAFNAMAEAIANAHETLRDASQRDPLTGQLNRRYFEQRLAEEVVRADRSEAPFAIALIDVDNLKLCNDRYGHEVGDVVLCEVARRVSSAARASDVLCRIGGDEFALILLGVDDGGGSLIATRARDAVRCEPVLVGDGHAISVTISVGGAAYDSDLDARTLLRIADSRLYEAKNNGRDHVCWTSDLNSTVSSE